jgi:hypothetical protein
MIAVHAEALDRLASGLAHLTEVALDGADEDGLHAALSIG